MSAPQEANYYYTYSDPEEQGARNPQEEAIPEDEDEDEGSEENDEDFKPRKQRSASLVPYNPHANSKSGAGDAEAGTKPPKHANGVNPDIRPLMDPHSAKSTRPEPLEPSILNAEPLDEFVLQVADWIYQQALGKSNIEVCT